MPRGTKHAEVGILQYEGDWYILKMPGGGRWRLDGGHKGRKLLGQIVRVEGTRGDFDILDVTRISPC